MAWHQTGRARVSTRSPEAFGVCDRCSFLYNRVDLRQVQQWAGPKLQTFNVLVCRRCWDVPQEQLRTIVLPPDPVPILNPRPEQYSAEVPSYISTMTGNHLTTMSGINLTMMIRITPSPDPNNPVLPG